MISKSNYIRLHGKALRQLCERVYDRDNGHCIICGRVVPEGAKPHHYPQGARKEDKMSHMVLLCYECHQKAHFGTAEQVNGIKQYCKEYLEETYGKL
jgi:hypothetical protein